MSGGHGGGRARVQCATRAGSPSPLAVRTGHGGPQRIVVAALAQVDGVLVCDNVRSYDDGAVGVERGVGRTGNDRRARESVARGFGALATGTFGTKRRERADALAGRARRDQPDAVGGGAHRGRPGPAPLAAAAPGRGRRRHGGPRLRAPARRGAAPRAPPPGADLLAARTASGGLASRARARP